MNSGLLPDVNGRLLFRLRPMDPPDCPPHKQSIRAQEVN